MDKMPVILILHLITVCWMKFNCGTANNWSYHVPKDLRQFKYFMERERGAAGTLFRVDWNN